MSEEQENNVPKTRPTVRLKRPANAADAAAPTGAPPAAGATRIKLKSKAAAAKSATSRVDLSEAVANNAPNASPQPAPSVYSIPADKKNETVRFSIGEDGLPGAPDAPSGLSGKAPKTIRLKRPGPASQPAATNTKAEKSHTSRIDINNALADAEERGEVAPKTIRLKRPATAGSETAEAPAETTKPTLKLTKKPVQKTATSAPDLKLSNKSETSRVELPADMLKEIEEDGAPSESTQKTLQIKRPGGGLSLQKSGSSLTGEKDEKEESVRTVADMDFDEEDDSEVGAGMAIAALFALLVTGALIYLQLAQTLVPSLPAGQL